MEENLLFKIGESLEHISQAERGKKRVWSRRETLIREMEAMIERWLGKRCEEQHLNSLKEGIALEKKQH